MTDLRVLFMQPRLCSRAAKEAATLVNAGVDVSLVELESGGRTAEYARFTKHVNLPYAHDIVSIVKNRRAILRDLGRTIGEIRPDVVHTHNGPDCFGAWLPGVTDVPVVHDVHDLQSVTTAKWPTTARFHRLKGHAVELMQKRWERAVTHRCAAVIATSPQTAEHLRTTHGAKRIYMLENKPVAGPVTHMPKLSARDGGTHLVYGGGITPYPGGPRDLLPAFERMADDGLDVHIYFVSFNDEHRRLVADRVARHARLHLHDVVPAERFVEEVSQYDNGLIWLTEDNPNVLMTSHNKMYEFQVAGIPIVTNQTRGFLADYVRARRCGIIVDDAAHVARALAAPPPITLDPSDCFMDAKDILAIYEKALAAR